MEVYKELIVAAPTTEELRASQVLEAVYANTGFAPEKLEWR